MINFNNFKNGLLALNTRRFGIVNSLIVQEYCDLVANSDKHCDAYNPTNGHNIEIAGSRAYSKNDISINSKNLVKVCCDPKSKPTLVKEQDADKSIWSCHIQQLRTSHFDDLIFSLFFEDKIKIFLVPKNGLMKLPNFSRKQHLGGKNEGQLAISNWNYDYFKDNFEIYSLSYREVYEAFGK